ncbi:sigma 54-interacting transcriptional regulator [candidate division WOR-3 bacterium]|nr:sigma 54-interacting transcriptional regulator [candidate division WOR-3 bacterium]
MDIKYNKKGTLLDENENINEECNIGNYHENIIEKIDTFFIIIDNNGVILNHTKGAKKELKLDNVIGKNINSICDLSPEEIWKTKCKNIEILWESNDVREHYILQNIPNGSYSILCFRKNEDIFNTFKIKTNYCYYSIDNIPGINKENKRKATMGIRCNKSILITGETGVGKEVLARAIHNDSRRIGPFIPINSSAIPRDLIESELFGYEPGSFTGSNTGGKKGLIELADKGTLFIDEIGDMPISIQTKLLRVIEDKTIWRLGARKEIKIDFRVICATNHDINMLVEKNFFRKDLYYRISFIEIDLSPLSDRLEYFSEFIEYFLIKHKFINLVFSKRAMNSLKSYIWPGNIRELEMVLESIILEKENSDDNMVRIENLPKKIINNDEIIANSLKDKIEILKRKEVEKAIKKYNNITKAAKHLGMTREWLSKYLKKSRL